MGYDLVLKNANIYTMDNELTKGRWIGIVDGKISSIGRDDNYPNDADMIVDMNNKTILPGFINSHIHSLATGSSESSFSLHDTNSIEEVLAIVRDACENADKDTLINFEGLNIHRLAENREPTMEELDTVSKGLPIMITYLTGHGFVLNREAIKRANIQLEDIKSEETARAVQGLMGKDVIKGFMHKCGELCVEAGITTIHSLIGGDLADDIDCKLWIDEEQKSRTLPIRILNYYQTTDVDYVHELGLPRIGGCICLDGTPVERTAAFTEAYLDKPGDRGALYLSDMELYKMVYDAHSLGMQCAFHAVGDRAVDQILHIYNRVIKELGNKGLRHRIEHCDLCSKDNMKLAAELGVVISVQPNIICMFAPYMEECLGAERSARMGNYSAYIGEGLILAGGTDTPITPLHPLLSIHHAVNNPHKNKRVSITDAIKMFTINGAYAARKEKDIGSIEIGKLADMVVLDNDIYESPDKIKDTKVDMTIVDGKIVYQRKAAKCS